MTIRKRLTLWYAALLTVIIILFGSVTFGVVRFTMLNTLDSTLKKTSSLILLESQLRPMPTFGAPTEIQIVLPSLDRFRASNIYVQAWEIDEAGQYRLADSSANLSEVSAALDGNALGFSGESDHIDNTQLQGRSLRVLTKAIPLGDRLVGNLQVAVDLETVNQATDLLLLVMLMSCIMAIFGAVALSMWFSDRALQPIESITVAAATIAETEDLSTRLRWNGPSDELGRLVSVFNQMMGRIEHLFSVQQRFVADISHELRTPLTAIQGNVEMVRRYGADAESLEAIEAETRRMARLVNDLLMLARADYGGMSMELFPMDLDTAVLYAYESTQSLLQDRQLTMQLGQFEPVRINGNTDRIKQVVSNLITNAIKFTEDGGSITVSLRKQDDEAIISVQDTGIGIMPNDLKRVFDRFYQSNPARTHTGEGFGLGLSIAKWIVEAHHGRITVRSTPGKGTTFDVYLPILQSPDTLEDTHMNQHKGATRPRLPAIRINRDTPTHHQPSEEHRNARN
ncbi:MAG: HAMP domain-containing sensor histidine kinase [Anaerolineae bacterium]